MVFGGFSKCAETTSEEAFLNQSIASRTKCEILFFLKLNKWNGEMTLDAGSVVNHAAFVLNDIKY